ncbi:MAG: flotillin family protein, partial [Mastigocladus sp. ERB_26_1]
AAREIFLFQKLEPLLKMMAAGVPQVEVENLTVIDAANGGNVPKLASLLEQLRQTTGIDISKAINEFKGDRKILIPEVKSNLDKRP